MKPLVVIPTFVRKPRELELVAAAVESVRRYEGDTVDVLLVDDDSPGHVGELWAIADEWRCDWHRQAENGGFSRAVNVGLRRALDERRDVVLMNADVELVKPVVERMVGQVELTGAPPHRAAWVVGGMLLYPGGELIQFAGTYLSLLTRSFDHRYRYAPQNLAEARKPAVSPITGALQFIRWECLEEIGLYDEDFRMGFEDVDFCLRVLLAGRECVYQPQIKALHHESVFRGGTTDEKLRRWQIDSHAHLAEKYADVSLTNLVPSL